MPRAHFRLPVACHFHSKSLYQIWLARKSNSLAWFHAISSIVGYFMPTILYAYILNIYELVWLFFYGISNMVGYLMPNHLYTYVSNIYDLVLLYFLHNGLAHLHKPTSTRASDGIHQSASHNHVWYHLRCGRIVTTPLDSQLPY